MVTARQIKVVFKDREFSVNSVTRDERREFYHQQQLVHRNTVITATRDEGGNLIPKIENLATDFEVKRKLNDGILNHAFGAEVDKLDEEFDDAEQDELAGVILLAYLSIGKKKPLNSD